MTRDLQALMQELFARCHPERSEGSCTGCKSVLCPLRIEAAIVGSLASLGMTTLRLVALFPAQFADRFGIIFCVKDRSTSDKDVGAILDRQTRSLGVDAAIDFEVDLPFARFVPFGGTFHFFHHLRPEWLPAEARMDGHDEQEVDLIEERLDCFEGRGGI
jgi:hypothetical protein